MRSCLLSVSPSFSSLLYFSSRSSLYNICGRKLSGSRRKGLAYLNPSGFWSSISPNSADRSTSGSICRSPSVASSSVSLSKISAVSPSESAGAYSSRLPDAAELLLADTLLLAPIPAVSALPRLCSPSANPGSPSRCSRPGNEPPRPLARRSPLTGPRFASLSSSRAPPLYPPSGGPPRPLGPRGYSPPTAGAPPLPPGDGPSPGCEVSLLLPI
mmetsp:Transcript_5831/g.24535  ORF Transcript_5831/g.24535 Transcript_5831/m.24535 type:complete len:214 (-) Transcript_5831:532-1173(-)